MKEKLNYNLKEELELFNLWNYISKNGKRHSVMIYFIYHPDKKPEFSSREKLQILWLTKENTIPIIKDKKLIEEIFRWKKLKNLK